MAVELSNTPAGLQEAKTAAHIDLEACYLRLQERIKRQLIKKGGFIIHPSPFCKQTATSYVFLTWP